MRGRSALNPSSGGKLGRHGIRRRNKALYKAAARLVLESDAPVGDLRLSIRGLGRTTAAPPPPDGALGSPRGLCHHRAPGLHLPTRPRCPAGRACSLRGGGSRSGQVPSFTMGRPPDPGPPCVPAPTLRGPSCGANPVCPPGRGRAPGHHHHPPGGGAVFAPLYKRAAPPPTFYPARGPSLAAPPLGPRGPGSDPRPLSPRPQWRRSSPLCPACTWRRCRGSTWLAARAPPLRFSGPVGPARIPRSFPSTFASPFVRAGRPGPPPRCRRSAVTTSGGDVCPAPVFAPLYKRAGPSPRPQWRGRMQVFSIFSSFFFPAFFKRP
jgi:hypothetical protein